MKKLAAALVGLLALCAPALAQQSQPSMIIPGTTPCINCTANRLLYSSGTKVAQSAAVANGLSFSGGILGIASTITAGGPIGSGTATPVISYNAQGQLTVVSTATITPPFSAVTGQATLAQLPSIATSTVLGNITGITAVPAALTQTQLTALINAATATLSGALPAWPNNTTTYFRGDGTYATLNAAAIAGLGTMATQNASAVAITGGTLAGLTGLAIRDTSAAFDLTIAAVSSTALTTGRTLTVDVVNAARTLKLGANLTIATDPGGITGALKSNGTGTFSQAACADLSNGATGCATATGTSGATIPLLNGANTWSGVQSFNSGDLALKGATSGTITLNAAATAGSNTLTLPAGTTDFSATGGTSQVIKQISAGAAFTVARLACADLSDSNTGCSSAAGTGSVTTVSVTTANGISGSVANPTTTPAITLTLGAITPTTVNGNTLTTGTGTLTLGSVTLNAGAGGTLGSNAFTSTAYLPLAGGTLTGNLIFSLDNTLDIGASGATRPRTGYFGTSLVSPLFNGLAITNNGTNTLAIAAGKTLTVSNTLTFTGTDSSSVAFGAGGTVLYANQSITLTGDVIGSGTTAITTVLANIPTATPMAGSLLATNITAPGTPASGKTSLYVDSTDKRLHDKNDAGTIGTTVVADTGTTNNYISAISAAGVITKSRPTCSTLSDAGTGCSATIASYMPIAGGTFTGGIGFSTTNTLDIGTSATVLAPRTIYAGTSFIGPAATLTTSVTVGAGSALTSTGAGGALGTNAFTSTAYAPLASPTFTGTVTMPDASTFATNFAVGANAILTGPAAASLQLGAADVDTNAAMVAQVLRTQGALTGGTTNQAGKDFTIIVSPGKGNQLGGKFIVQTTIAGASNNTTNTPSTKFVIQGSGFGITDSQTAPMITGTPFLGILNSGASQPSAAVWGLGTFYGLVVAGQNYYATAFINASGTAAIASGWQFGRARGTLASPSVVSIGDDLGFAEWKGHNGGTVTTATMISSQVDAAPSSSSYTPGRLMFHTTSGAGGAIEKWRITSVGDFISKLDTLTIKFGASSDVIIGRGGAANLQLGDVTGAGAAVAQTLSVQGSSGASAAAALFTIAGSDQSGTGTTGGAVTLRAGNSSGASGTRTGGALTLQGGTGASAGGQIIFQTAATTSWTTALTLGVDQSATFVGIHSITNTTDSTNTSSGSFQTAGGGVVAKRFWIPGITASAGLQTAVLCQSSGGEMIADSVACLASASRFKNILGPMPDGALEKIMGLKIERWAYKAEGQFKSDDWTRERIGPIADDVAKMDDRLAGYDQDGRVRTYSTEQLLGFTIKALQELKAENDNLRSAFDRRSAN